MKIVHSSPDFVLLNTCNFFKKTRGKIFLWNIFHIQIMPKYPTHALSQCCDCPAVDSWRFDTSLWLLLCYCFLIIHVYGCSCFIYYVLLWPRLYLQNVEISSKVWKKSFISVSYANKLIFIKCLNFHFVNCAVVLIAN